MMASGSICTFSDASRLKRLNSIMKFIKETQPGSLDLSGRNIHVDDLKSILKYLPDSQVTELILKENNLASRIKELTKLLPKTEIRKLDVSSCHLSFEDYFDVMEVMKDTKITELFLDSDDVAFLGTEDRDRFVSLTLASHLKIFDYGCVDLETDFLLFQAIPRTSFTQVETKFGADTENLIMLFSNLRQSLLTSLQIECYGERIDTNVMIELSHSLRESKLEKLTLKCEDTNDRLVDILIKGLVHSKVLELNLCYNEIRGSKTLGLRLKDTHIKKLNLSGNHLDQYEMVLCPDFLRCSSVTDLDVSHCQLDAEHFQKIMESVKIF